MANRPGIFELRARIVRFIGSSFGTKLVTHRWERSMRVLEEAIELAQAEGVSEEDAIRLVKRVFTKPVGNPIAEGAQVGIVWLAWTIVHGLDPIAIMEEEHNRVAAMPTEKFRKRQKDKALAGLGLFPDEGM